MIKSITINPYLIFYIISSGSLTLLISNNQIIFAGTVLVFTIAIFLLWSLLNENSALRFATVIFVFSPFLAFLRQYVISYNGISFILLIALLLWLLKYPKITVKEILRDKKILGISIFIAIYVIYGLIKGVPLARFMKYIETFLTILLFAISFNYLEYFRKHLIYFIISSILVVISVLQHIETRFIFQVGEEIIKADPSAYSIGLVLSAFFLIQENGRWVFSTSRGRINFIRYGLLIFVITLTFLTTSRIGFFSLIGSYLVFANISRTWGKSIIPLVVAIVAAFVFITNSRYYEISEKWFNKTFKNEKGIEYATSGRLDQWKMAGYFLVNAPPEDVLFGIGPGKGPDFTSEYSRIVPGVRTLVGKQMQLHSLYHNILIEYGVIAFIFFAGFLYRSGLNSYSIYKKYNITLPFLSFLAYLIYIGSVTGNGIIPAMFISLFLLKPEQLNSSIPQGEIQQVL